MRRVLLASTLVFAVGCSSTPSIQPGGSTPSPDLADNSGNGDGDGGTGVIGNLWDMARPNGNVRDLGPGGTGPGSDGDGGTGPGTLPTRLAIAGQYDVETQFNFLDTLPPDVETALQLALEFANSPGSFVLDMAGRLPVVKYVVEAIDLFSGIRNAITMGIDEYINRWSGGMVSVMHQMSIDLTMGLRGLKSHNHLVIGPPDAMGNASVQDTLVDLTFSYQGTDYRYPQGAKATTNGLIAGLKVKIAAHPYDKGVRFGGILLDIVDNIALPALTGVNSLGDLLNQLVNCAGVADHVWGYIGNWCLTDDPNTCIYKYVSANDLSKLCVNALDAAGNFIEKEISKLDAPGMMSISEGNCIALENHGHTGHADSLTNGTWTLTLPIGIGVVPLPGTFTGAVSH
jgi:hypothetical protein